MKKILLLVVFLICINSVYASLIVNEIMYNPSEDENYNEWIEIYNDGNEEIDLSFWKLCSKSILGGFINNSDSKEYANEGSILLPGEYGIISDGKSGTQIYNNLEISGMAFHIDSASLCGGLSNSGKSINLTSDNQNINLIYKNLAKEGYSIEFYNNQWYQSLELGGTPGKENSAHVDNEVIETQEEDNKKSESSESKLEILDVDLGKDNKAKFGDGFLVKVSVLKGDTSKYSVNLYAQDKEKNIISKKTKFNVYKKNSEYTLSLPIQLIPNCKNKYKNGDYEMVLEGLDSSDSKDFSIEGINGDLCIEVKQECKNSFLNKSNDKTEESPMDNETSDTKEYNKKVYVKDYEENGDSDKYLNKSVNVNYESKDKKLKSLAIYFLIFCLILLSTYLLIKNERTKINYKSNN